MNRFRTFLAAAAVLAATGLAAAQTDPHATQPGPGITVDFPGGTVNQYIAALKKASGGIPVNAIVSEQAGDQVLPAISLKSVTAYTALTAIESAAGRGEGGWAVHPIVDPGTNSIGAITVDFIANDRGGRTLEVFSTQELLTDGSGLSPDVMLTAVDTALQMESGGRSKAEVMFHKDSGLLLIRGTGPQVHAVSQVISCLHDDSARRGKDTARSRQVSANQEAEIKKCEVRVGLAEQRVALASQDLSETEGMVKGGFASTADVRNRTQALSQARAEFEIAKIDMDRARAEAATGADLGGDDMNQLRGIIAQLQAEVAALKQALGEQNSGGTR